MNEMEMCMQAAWTIKHIKTKLNLEKKERAKQNQHI